MPVDDRFTRYWFGVAMQQHMSTARCCTAPDKSMQLRGMLGNRVAEISRSQDTLCCPPIHRCLKLLQCFPVHLQQLQTVNGTCEGLAGCSVTAGPLRPFSQRHKADVSLCSMFFVTPERQEAVGLETGGQHQGGLKRVVPQDGDTEHTPGLSSGHPPPAPLLLAQGCPEACAAASADVHAWHQLWPR
jgi:hypothetical protein